MWSVNRVSAGRTTWQTGPPAGSLALVTTQLLPAALAPSLQAAVAGQESGGQVVISSGSDVLTGARHSPLDIPHQSRYRWLFSQQAKEGDMESDSREKIGTCFSI